MKLVFASSNPHKLKEIKKIVADFAELISLAELDFFDEIPETASTIEGNALLKANFCFNRFKLNSFADDTGLEVDCLSGAPGVYSARYAGEDKNDQRNIELLLKNMAGSENRKARFKTVIALVVDEKKYLFEGVVEGNIATQARGNMGFGYDSVFIPENSFKTFAEMELEEKNSMSHRARALEKLMQFFKSEI